MDIIQSGIYAITNSVNGKVYIGSAVDIRRRWSQHLHKLRRGNHDNPHLQASWTAYGSDAFLFERIELVQPEQLIEAETRWILHFESQDPEKGYNFKQPLTGSHGRRKTEAQRRLVSLSLTGRKQSQETKDKRAESHRGRKNSPETIEKMCESQKRAWTKQQGRHQFREAQLRAVARSFKITDPQGQTQVVVNLKEWCRLNGFIYNSVQSAIRRSSPHKEWRFQHHAQAN
jgi:group I intron endonuclease